MTGPRAAVAAAGAAADSVGSMAGETGAYVLITGGAGFIGANLADRLLTAGEPVAIYDDLSRPGSESNLRWLSEKHRARRLSVTLADVRDAAALRTALAGAVTVYHLAAQAAATASVADPRLDFDVNLRGTFQLLDELRRRADPPPLVFASTNKVYGALTGLELRVRGDRYEPADPEVRAHGIGEDQRLDFCGPYGCSKGAADQYVLDFARTYGLPLAVFRLSCVYGPRQDGTGDHGWVSFLLRRALEGSGITIYGDGRQVRDILFVEDLVDAFLAARARMAAVRGRAFNIGGGPANTISVRELIEVIGREQGETPGFEYAGWRIGDQKYYASDTRRFEAATGWAPRVTAAHGLRALLWWLRDASAARVPAGTRA